MACLGDGTHCEELELCAEGVELLREDFLEVPLGVGLALDDQCVVPHVEVCVNLRSSRYLK